jgi:energy-coupling factor transporter ATP-binding protein EcfA2
MLQGLKEAAREYWLQGFNVVAVAYEQDEDDKVSKKPLVEWGKWQTERQSLEDFETQPWDAADGFGVICNIPNKDGYYLAVVDYDVKNVSIEALKRGEAFLKRFPITQMEQTVSKGKHLVYLSKVKPKPVSSYHDSHGLELIAGPKICIMAPSKGYVKLNENPPTIVEDAEGLFYQILGVGDDRTAANEGLPLNMLGEWLGKVKASLNVAGEGAQYLYVHCPFHPPDNHPSFALHKTKFYAIDYHDGKVYSLKQLAEALGIELDGLKKTLSVSLGNFRLNVVKRDAFLHNNHGEPIFTCKLYALNTEKTKAKLSELTGVDKRELEQKVAALVFRSHEMQNDEDESGKAEVEDNAKQPLMLDDETETQIEAEVRRVLETDNQLAALKPHLDVCIVGEDENKLAILTLLAGSKYDDVDKKQIILLKGTEGGGKTTIASTLTGFFKTKEVGRFSEHALEYSDLKGYEVLYIKELGSMDMDKQGVASIKFLSADDKGFIVEYTMKGEDGRFRTEQKRIPAITTVSTTTRLVLDSQFERRSWLFNVDEGEEQTERIKKWKAWLGRQKDEVKLGIRKITDYDFSKEVIRRVVSNLKPQKIVIPFRETLTEVLGSKNLRVRGDVDKLYTFIELYGLFNIKRLQKLREDVYALTPEVAIEALKIIEKPLTNMLGKMDERVKPLLEALKEIPGVEERLTDEGQTYEEPIKYDVKGAEIDKKVREQIAIRLGKSERTVRELLNYLEACGYASSDQKKPKTYTLLYNVEDIEAKIIGVSAISKTADLLMEKMEKEAQNWLKTGLENLPPQGIEKGRSECGPKQLEGKITPIQASLGERIGENWRFNESPIFQGKDVSASDVSPTSAKEGSPTHEPLLSPSSAQLGISNPFLSTSQGSFIERSEKDRRSEKSPIPRGLLQCEHCAQQGRSTFFASKHDLDLHVKTVHKHGC